MGQHQQGQDPYLEQIALGRPYIRKDQFSVSVIEQILRYSSSVSLERARSDAALH
jgi:hypothetical protein